MASPPEETKDWDILLHSNIFDDISSIDSEGTRVLDDLNREEHDEALLLSTLAKPSEEDEAERAFSEIRKRKFTLEEQALLTKEYQEEAQRLGFKINKFTGVKDDKLYLHCHRAGKPRPSKSMGKRHRPSKNK